MAELTLGYKASAEQFGPQELVDLSVHAEELGLDLIAVSDHFQPWRHTGGHSPAVLPWLGALTQRTSRASLGTSVLTPTMRYHPSVVAQAFATARVPGTGTCLSRRRHRGGDERDASDRQRLAGCEGTALAAAESIELMRRLWTEERVTFAGDYYRTERATVYDRPTEAGPRLRRRLRTAGRQARRPRR